MLLQAISCWVLPCCLSSCFVIPGKHRGHLAWERESWSICFSCIDMFILHALPFVVFSSSWCRRFATDCDFGTSRTFHLTFYGQTCNHIHFDWQSKKISKSALELVSLFKAKLLIPIVQIVKYHKRLKRYICMWASFKVSCVIKANVMVEDVHSW